MMNFNSLRITQEICTAFAVLCMTPLVFSETSQANDDRLDEHQVCGEYGTTIEFANSPVEAAKRALAEEKLVFVLHVSGDFETPEYT